MEVANGFSKGFPADETHGIKGSAIGMGALTIDRDNARMFQSAGDLALQHEAAEAGRVCGVLGLNLLEGYLTMQFGVLGNIDFAQTAASMEAEQPVATSR